jgi:two-component system, cell cycle sensor histidine kinase and response regulator CckA
MVITQLRTPLPRILVVEDEDLVLKVVLRLLQHHGFQATGVRDGSEAIALMREVLERGEHFSAAIVDSNLPNGLSGRETLKILRRLDGSMRAILTSGDLSRVALVADPSYDAVVPKPFEMESLRRTLECLLSQPPRRVAAPE